MKVVVTANGTELDSPASPVFGRCPVYTFVDTETMAFEALENPAMSAPSGAGIQAAQFIAGQGAQAVITGSTGPNAFNVLQSANVTIYLFPGGTVREAIEAYKTGQLSASNQASGQAHAGMGRGAGMGMGRGMGMGSGRGMGMGRGMGVGMGMGTGRGAVVPQTPPPAAGPAPSREDEIASLRTMADDLRRQLEEVTNRLDQYDKER